MSDLSPLQKNILELLEKAPDRTAKSSDLADTLSTRPQAVGAALSHLRDRGIVTLVRRGVWKLGTHIRPVEPTNGRYPDGTLFEVAGYTEAGTLVLRNMDTRTLLPVKPHTAVTHG